MPQWARTDDRRTGAVLDAGGVGTHLHEPPRSGRYAPGLSMYVWAGWKAKPFVSNRVWAIRRAGSGGGTYTTRRCTAGSVWGMQHAEMEHISVLPPLRVDAGTHSAPGWLRWSGLRSPTLGYIHPSMSRALARFPDTYAAIYIYIHPRQVLSRLGSDHVRPLRRELRTFRLFVAAADALHSD